MDTAIISAVIFVISLAGALWQANRDPSRERQTRILVFALYFWVLAFVQLIIAAIVYALMNT